MNTEEIQSRLSNNYQYRKPDAGMVERHEDIRGQCHTLAVLLQDRCPPSRELSVAQTKLEEVMFWANAAVARQLI